MKKSLVGSLVGGIIIFIWQFLSFGAINFHRPAQDFTEKQDAILSFLNGQGLKEGGYVLPNYPEGAGREEIEKGMKASEGKPWAILQYHKEMETDMVMNIIRSLLVDILTIWMFCWLIGRMTAPSFGTIFAGAVLTGLIVFFNAPYIGHIWYKTFDIWAFFLDAVVSWGLVGLWLAWWLRRRPAIVPATAGGRRAEMSN